MKGAHWMILGLALIGAPLAAQQEKKTGLAAVLPVTGLKAGCCDSAAEKALGALNGVEKAAVKKEGNGKVAVILLKKDAALELSAVQQALSKASKEMGESMSMELDYRIDEEALMVGEGVGLQTAALSEEQKKRLETAWRLEKGCKSSKIEASSPDHSLLCLTFEKGKSPSLSKARTIVAKCDLTVDEVVLRGAPAISGTLPQAEAKHYTCSMCGGDFDKPGDCPKCGMSLTEKGQKKKKGG